MSMSAFCARKNSTILSNRRPPCQVLSEITLTCMHPWYHGCMNILIIGGAGYIGGVTAHMAVKEGHRVTVADDLSTGNNYNVPDGADFIHIDVRKRDDVAKM